jgi:hypothetical protein
MLLERIGRREDRDRGRTLQLSFRQSAAAVLSSIRHHFHHDLSELSLE